MRSPEERAATVASLRVAMVYKKRLDELDDQLLAKIPQIDAALKELVREKVSVPLERVIPERVIERRVGNRPLQRTTIPAVRVPVGVLWWRKFAGHPTEPIQQGPWRLVFENMDNNSIAMVHASREVRLLCFQALPALMGAFESQLAEKIDERKKVLEILTPPTE